MKLKALAFFAGAMASTQAVAVNWIYVTTSIPASDYYVDFDSIRTISSYVGSTKIAWFKLDHSRNKSESARSSKNLYEAKCDSSELKLNQWIDYKADGTVLNSSNGKSYGTFQVVAPETVGYSVLEAICNPSALVE
jgi:hypothetical protein